MNEKFLLLFQNSIQPDKDPDFIFGISLGETFEIKYDKDEPLYTHYILPLDKFQKIICWAILTCYGIRKGSTSWYSISDVHLDGFIDLINN